MCLHRCPLALAMSLVPAVLPAQSRFGWAVAFVQSQPVGDFRQSAKRGSGYDGAVTLAVDRAGFLSLRAEGSRVTYGVARSRFVVPLGFGPVTLEQETTNEIETWGLGPQLTVAAGPVRPYLAGMVGRTSFSTVTSIWVPEEEASDTETSITLDEQKNFSHVGRTVGALGGVLVRLSSFGFRAGEVLLDVGVRYQRTPHARFVRPGDVHANDTAFPDITTSAGEANVVSYRLGIAARFD